MIAIKPTPGRVVWYHPRGTDGLIHEAGTPLAAHIARVWSDTCVNLMVIDANGDPHSKTSVLLHQEGNPRPDAGYAEWMPYQVGQAKKAEA